MLSVEHTIDKIVQDIWYPHNFRTSFLEVFFFFFKDEPNC